MTVLSVTAVSYLAEWFVRQHAPIELGAVVVLLAAVDVPAPRAHAGIQRAIDRGAIGLTDDDRQVLIAADPNLRAAGAPRKGATSAVGHAALAADMRATATPVARATAGQRQGLERCSGAADCRTLVQPGRLCRECRTSEKLPRRWQLREGGPEESSGETTRSPAHLCARKTAYGARGTR